VSYLCRYRPDPAGRWFESATKQDERFYVCGVRGDLAGADFEQEKPARVPAPLDPYRNADPIGSEWMPTLPNPTVPVSDLPGEAATPFLSRLADIFDGIPDAPLGSPVLPEDCAWCRVTKKASGYAAWVIVGLLVAYLSRKLFRA
jgi:hypothetical protein